MKLSRLLCFVLMLVAPLAHAWNPPEMAKYGSAYSGPELLHVYVGHNKADTHAVVKIVGINHPYDGKSFWVKVTYAESSHGKPPRVSYTDEQGKLLVSAYVNGSSTALYLPNYRSQLSAEIPLGYDRTESQSLSPRYMAEEYKRQIDADKK